MNRRHWTQSIAGVIAWVTMVTQAVPAGYAQDCLRAPAADRSAEGERALRGDPTWRNGAAAALGSQNLASLGRWIGGTAEQEGRLITLTGPDAPSPEQSVSQWAERRRQRLGEVVSAEEQRDMIARLAATRQAMQELLDPQTAVAVIMDEGEPLERVLDYAGSATHRARIAYGQQHGGIVVEHLAKVERLLAEGLAGRQALQRLLQHDLDSARSGRFEEMPSAAHKSINAIIAVARERANIDEGAAVRRADLLAKRQAAALRRARQPAAPSAPGYPVPISEDNLEALRTIKSPIAMAGARPTAGSTLWNQFETAAQRRGWKVSLVYVDPHLISPERVNTLRIGAVGDDMPVLVVRAAQGVSEQEILTTLVLHRTHESILQPVRDAASEVISAPVQPVPVSEAELIAGLEAHLERLNTDLAAVPDAEVDRLRTEQAEIADVLEALRTGTWSPEHPRVQDVYRKTRGSLAMAGARRDEEGLSSDGAIGRLQQELLLGEAGMQIPLARALVPAIALLRRARARKATAALETIVKDLIHAQAALPEGQVASEMPFLERVERIRAQIADSTNADVTEAAGELQAVLRRADYPEMVARKARAAQHREGGVWSRQVTWETPIEELPLSARLSNRLIEARFQTVGDVIAHADEVRQLPGLGRHSFSELKELLADYGFSLRPNYSPLPSLDISEDIQAILVYEAIRGLFLKEEAADRELTVEQQFNTVRGALERHLPALVPHLDGLRHLVTEPNPDIVTAALQQLPVTDEERRLLRLAFFSPGEGGGPRLGPEAIGAAIGGQTPAQASRINAVTAREVLDSRGNPTVEATVTAWGGATGTAQVPSGASTGSREALELRDGDAGRFKGKGVSKAVQNVLDAIAPVLATQDAANQRSLDEQMVALDGTENKSRLGANAMLGVSLAAARAAANATGQPLYRYLGGEQAATLPMPMFNIMNGGRHAKNNLTMQEFMIVPVGAKSFHEAYKMGLRVFEQWFWLLVEKGYTTADGTPYAPKDSSAFQVTPEGADDAATIKALQQNLARAIVSSTGETEFLGDEKGFAPNVKNEEEAMALILEAIRRAGYEPGTQVALALDPAASEFYGKNVKTGQPTQAGQYRIGNEDVSSQQLIERYQQWQQRYPIVSIEDGLAEDDPHWRASTDALGHRIQLVGDDRFVTNPKLFRQGIDAGEANAILIKVNQIGTLTETLDVVQMAKDHRYRTVISHRSGETEDDFIADLAVATTAGQIKTGSPFGFRRYSRAVALGEAPTGYERAAKYDRLLHIEQELGARAKFAGWQTPAQTMASEVFALYRRSADIAPPGGEHLGQVQARGWPVFEEEILNQQIKQGQHVILSSSGNLFRSLTKPWFGETFADTFPLGTPVHVQFVLDEDGQLKIHSVHIIRTAKATDTKNITALEAFLKQHGINVRVVTAEDHIKLDGDPRLGRLTLLRHGETIASDTYIRPGETTPYGGFFAGWMDVPLSPLGEQQATAAGEAMLNLGIAVDVVLTSDLQRASNTLELALQTMGRANDVTRTPPDARLRERNYGALQGVERGPFVQELVRRIEQLWEAEPSLRRADPRTLAIALAERWEPASAPPAEAPSARQAYRERVAKSAVNLGEASLVVAHSSFFALDELAQRAVLEELGELGGGSSALQLVLAVNGAATQEQADAIAEQGFEHTSLQRSDFLMVLPGSDADQLLGSIEAVAGSRVVAVIGEGAWMDRVTAAMPEPQRGRVARIPVQATAANETVSIEQTLRAAFAAASDEPLDPVLTDDLRVRRTAAGILVPVPIAVTSTAEAERVQAYREKMRAAGWIGGSV